MWTLDTMPAKDGTLLPRLTKTMVNKNESLYGHEVGGLEIGG
jgi:hypothetical protein